ncbi:hypothetical protein R1sor_018214 [Riccia sorocarpa]|uniref:Uncharacterized protein n=1 Tax=Riccia sorocarpa TaxID=122646 RepID=A0ABD3IBS9_9MARC
MIADWAGEVNNVEGNRNVEKGAFFTFSARRTEPAITDHCRGKQLKNSNREVPQTDPAGPPAPKKIRQMAEDDLMIVASQIMKQSEKTSLGVSPKVLMSDDDGSESEDDMSLSKPRFLQHGRIIPLSRNPEGHDRKQNVTVQLHGVSGGSEKGQAMDETVGNKVVRSSEHTAPKTRAELRLQAKERKTQAWSFALRSVECVTKNVNRFSRLNKPKGNVPYPETQQNVTVTEERLSELKETFSFLRSSNQVPEGKRVKKTYIDTQKFINRMDYLRDRSFVLYTVNAFPTCEVITEWSQRKPRLQAPAAQQNLSHSIQPGSKEQEDFTPVSRRSTKSKGREIQNGNQGLHLKNNFQVLQEEDSDTEEGHTSSGEDVDIPADLGNSKVQPQQEQILKSAEANVTQELRLKKNDAEFRLRQICDPDRWVIDYIEEGKAGTVLLILTPGRILRRGTKGDGTVAWASVQTEDGILNLASIHGPTTRENRDSLWDWLQQRWEKGTWVLAGD